VNQSQVPFPSALVDPGKKNEISHTSLEKDELLDVFKQVKVNIPLLESIKKFPLMQNF